ncbi:MAG: GNAT family N-acetyltransferase [Acidobacteriota bacterium]
MEIRETERLRLRRLTFDDAPFILRLLNEPSFLRYIGDKGVRTIEDAQQYILHGPQASYEQHGFGLYLVTVTATGAAAGICGLIKRDTLPDVDVGYAFLPAFWGQGYAVESAAAVLSEARDIFGLTRVAAVTTPDNDSSIRVLERLGFRYERLVNLTAHEPAVKLFMVEL